MTKNLKIFFAICLVLIAGLSFWGFKYNNGTLVIESTKPNFSITINDKTQNCLTSCSLTLPPKAYTVTLKKEGYTSLETKIFLVRGETETLNYSPTFIPKFSLLESNTSDDISEVSTYKFEVSATQQGAQLLQVLLANELTTISTFKEPILEPMASIAPDSSSTFVWSNQTVTDYYLVNNRTKLKQKLDLTTENFNFQKPTNFKLLSANLLLVQADKAYLYRIDSETLVEFPVNNINNVHALAENSLLLLTGRNLKSSESLSLNNSTQTPFNQITNLIDKSDQDLTAELSSPASKIFVFDANQGTYQYLGELPPEIVEPFEFIEVKKTDQDTQNSTTALKVNDQYYELVLNGNS
jgi:hypothetical protein